MKRNQVFKKILNISFLKAFSVNSTIVLGKLIASFIVSKVSAIFLGPSGYAIVGNFKNVLQSVLGITASGFESGIIKYIAENKQDEKKINIITASGFLFSITLSLIVGVFLFVFSNWLSITVLKDESLAFVFKYFAFILPLISLNFLVVYVLNGFQKLRVFTLVISLSNILNALITFLLVYFYDLRGALMASILVPALSLGFSLFIKEVKLLFVVSINNLKLISLNFLKSISTYLIMAIYSTILMSMSYLLIRNNIISNFDAHSAGLWEAMNKLSSFYMLFFSSLFTLYLLPLLAINKTIGGYLKIMKSYFKFLIPFVIILFLGISLFRVLIIKIFLTEEFAIIERFFNLQMLGDFFKIVAFSIAYQFHAKKMVLSYIVSDAILYISFFIASVFLLKYYELVGVFYAYIFSVLLYLISVCSFVFFKRHKYLKSEN